MDSSFYGARELYYYTLGSLREMETKDGIGSRGTDWEGEKRGNENLQSKGPLRCLQKHYFFPLPEATHH